jgi:hypothetical protein
VETSLTELNPILLHLNKIIHEKESDQTRVATGVQDAHRVNPYYDEYDRYDPRVDHVIKHAIYSERLNWPLKKLHLEQLEHDRLLAENLEDIRNGRPPRHSHETIKGSKITIAEHRYNLGYASHEEYSPYDTHLPDLHENKGGRIVPGISFAPLPIAPNPAAEDDDFDEAWEKVGRQYHLLLGKPKPVALYTRRQKE